MWSASTRIDAPVRTRPLAPATTVTTNTIAAVVHEALRMRPSVRVIVRGWMTTARGESRWVGLILGAVSNRCRIGHDDSLDASQMQYHATSGQVQPFGGPHKTIAVAVEGWVGGADSVTTAAPSASGERRACAA